MGVLGGLPLMFLFIAILAKAFSLVGQTLREAENKLSSTSRFMIWALGASLFSHATTFMSVSYFDQSFVFLYLTLAAISSAAIQSTQSPVKSSYFTTTPTVITYSTKERLSGVPETVSHRYFNTKKYRK
jgi:O-antigen ligase